MQSTAEAASKLPCVRSKASERRAAFRFLGFRAWGLGFRAWGLGFRVWGLGFRVWGLGFRVWGLGFRAWGLGFRVEGFGASRAYLKDQGTRRSGALGQATMLVGTFNPQSGYL